jgi:hypothetical protein
MLKERNTATTTATRRSPQNETTFSNDVGKQSSFIGKRRMPARSSSHVKKMGWYAYVLVDIFVVAFLFGIASLYMFTLEEDIVGSNQADASSLIHTSFMNGTGKDNDNDNDNDNGMGASIIATTKKNFENSIEDAPSCRPLDEHEVTFSLAIALSSENDLSMISHHCKRWGISAPISIAVWTSLSPAGVMEKIRSFKYNACQPEQMTIATLSPFDEQKLATDNNPPINQLRNLAMQGIQTSHVISLDVGMWESVDLYETLNTPLVIRSLSQDPKLAIVIPAFEVNIESYSSRKECMRNIPSSFDGLIIQLGEKRVSPKDPLHFSRHGSTQYRSWVKQAYGELIDIDCVSSDGYEPFIAVRYCEGLPPFQEVFGASDMISAWITHVLRLGYSLKQVGGAFVVDLPISNGNGKEDSSEKIDTYLRKTNEKDIRSDVFQWLDTNIPDHRRVQNCDDFEEVSEDETA